jgi:hypothetical protein
MVETMRSGEEWDRNEGEKKRRKVCTQYALNNFK